MIRKGCLVLLCTVIIITTILCISGCPAIGDNISEEDTRFVSIGDKYKIINIDYYAVYDSKTTIVYLVNTNYRYGITALYDEYGMPMTLAEYYETRK